MSWSRILKIPNLGDDSPLKDAALDLGVDPNDYELAQYLKIWDSGLRADGFTVRDYSSVDTDRAVLTPSCVEYDGSTQYSTCGTHPLAGATKCTMAAWVYLADGTHDFPMVVSGSDGAGTDRVEFCFSSTTERLALFVNATSLVADAGDAMTPAEWHHVACTATQSEADVTTELFIDGASVKTGAIASEVLATSWAAVLWTGAREISSTLNYYFGGRISDVYLFDEVISDADIAILADACPPHPEITATPVAHYPLEERSGFIGYDTSGSSQHLTHEWGWAYLVDDNLDYLVDDNGNYLIGDT